MKYMHLINLFLDKKDSVLKKLNLLTLLPENDMEKEECYINLIKYYEDMKAILDELLNYKSILEKTLDSPQKMYLYKINKYIKEINTGTYNTFYNLKSKMKKIINNLKKIKFPNENNINIINNGNDIINYNYNELKNEYIKLKNENKKLKEINSRYPFILLENEYILTLIIISKDEKVLTSLICKNTDEFSKVESRFYQEYPEYLQNKGYFKSNNLINKNKSLEENKLKNNSIIIFENFLGEDENKDKNDIYDNIENNNDEKNEEEDDDIDEDDFSDSEKDYGGRY